MSELLGAWSLSGRPVKELVPDGEWAAFAAACPDDGAQVLETPRLRLSAGRGKLAASAGRARAYEGWAASGLTADWASRPPDGHFAAADVDLAGATLRLWRDPGGGEKLYYAVAGELLLFSSSIRPFLARSGARPKMDEEVALERAVGEIVHFGDRSLVEGVREILPGYVLEASAGVARARWAWDDLLMEPAGSEDALSADLKRRLGRAVASMLEGRREAAVALSGGLDSGAVAAAAAEAVGARNVVAYTFTFNATGKPNEAALAAAVCRRLGIERHRVLRLSYEACRDAALDAVRLSEEPTCWARPHAVLLARAVAADGFDRFLTGFGVGSHMAYLADVARALRWLPAPLLLRLWAGPHFNGRRPGPSRFHPGLTSPDYPVRTPLFYLLALTLERRGLVGDAAACFPAPLRAAVRRLARSQRVTAAVAEVAELPLGQALRRLSFQSLDSCVDLHRLQRLSRGCGATWLSPFHAASVLPLVYMPLAEGAERDGARPGKTLLRAAMSGVLPPEVVDRPKVWGEATAPDAWLKEIARAANDEARPSLEALSASWGVEPAALLRYAHNGAMPVGLWHRLFMPR